MTYLHLTTSSRHKTIWWFTRLWFWVNGHVWFSKWHAHFGAYHPYFNFSQSGVFAHVYICVHIEQIIHWKCVFMLYSSVYMYFYSIKGIASIPNHLEILYYIYDYFSFLSNPTTTTTEMLLCRAKCARQS